MSELLKIKGIGDKSLKYLKTLNINSIEELLSYYPYRYIINKINDVSQLEDGEIIVCTP